MTEKSDSVVKTLRTETKISYILITFLLTFLGAFIGRETVTSQIHAMEIQIANLEKGRALNEKAIQALEADGKVKMQILGDIQKNLGDIKILLAEHTGKGSIK